MIYHCLVLLHIYFTYLHIYCYFTYIFTYISVQIQQYVDMFMQIKPYNNINDIDKRKQYLYNEKRGRKPTVKLSLTYNISYKLNMQYTYL